MDNVHQSPELSDTYEFFLTNKSEANENTPGLSLRMEENIGIWHLGIKVRNFTLVRITEPIV